MISQTCLWRACIPFALWGVCCAVDLDQESRAQSFVGYNTGVVSNSTVAGNGTGIDAHGKIVIQSDGIRVAFIPYGARITNLFVNDSSGVERDIVLGYDSAVAYVPSFANETFGGLLGRYTSPVANHSFQLSPGETVYNTSLTPDTNATLQGGPTGWNTRNWTIVAHTTNSATFSLTDNDNAGFPGQTITYVTYSATPNQWSIRVVGISTTQYTPLMPASQVFWNLDAAADPSTPTVLNQTLRLPYSGQRVQLDPETLVPTGMLEENALYSVNDFWHASKALGRNFTSRYMHNNCGNNCTGYDNAFLINRDAGQGRFDWTRDYVAQLQSKFSGIRMYMYTDQAAVQVMTCNDFDGTIPLKAGQGIPGDSTRSHAVQKYGCLALTPSDWQGGVNHPGWQRAEKQAYGPGDPPYVWQAAYSFATTSTTVTCATRTATVTVNYQGVPQVSVTTVSVTATVTATTTPVIFK